MFIFPRVNYKDHFIRGAPAGSIGKATRSGWIDCSIFVKYIRHIIKHTRCTSEHKILHILDNHESHISIQAIDLANENGIVMLTVPPHASHRLQPLDCVVYGPFKAVYDQAINTWLRSNPGKTVAIYGIPTIVSEAHLSAMTLPNITAGFKSTGIHLFNRDLFAEGDFAPSESTDKPDPSLEDANVAEPETDLMTPETSARPADQSQTAGALPSDDKYVSPSALVPISKAGPRKATNKGRKKG